MIFAANEGGSKSFADSIESMGLLMYPLCDWRTLPEDHWAFTVHDTVKGKRPALRGLSNGVRELIILSPGGDLPATFQKNDVKAAADYETAANLYYYASELNQPRPRLAQHFTRRGETGTLRSAGTIVRALQSGNWKPEPQALEIFRASLARDRGIDATVSDHPLSKINEPSPSPTLVIVSGIDAVTFTPTEMEAIKAYITAGGVILFETPGGRGEFTASAERIAESTFGKPLESVLNTSIITGKNTSKAKDLTQVSYRPFSLQAFGTRETAPRLRGITVDEKRGPQLLFSREDISHAMLDQPRWGISGYSPQSARDLLANIVQFAMKKSD